MAYLQEDDVAQQPCCTHLTVKYKTASDDDGSIYAWWECEDCQCRFWPAIGNHTCKDFDEWFQAPCDTIDGKAVFMDCWETAYCAAKKESNSNNINIELIDKTPKSAVHKNIAKRLGEKLMKKLKRVR